MKKVKRVNIACVAILSVLFVGTGFAANVTQINRYTTVDNKPLASQVNPLLTVQQIRFPQQVRSVGEAVSWWLQYSGFSMVPEGQFPPVLKDVLQQPLPQAVRSLGPLTVQDGLQVLVGQQVFSLVQDPLLRRVSFQLKPQYAHLANKHKGHIA